MIKNIKNKYYYIITIFFTIILAFFVVNAQTNNEQNDLSEQLSGKFLLQTEEQGQIWYIDPETKQRHQLDKDNAINFFASRAIGITDNNIERIPTKYEILDTESDSDQDGYKDYVEAKYGYNIFGTGRSIVDNKLVLRLSGKFLLQVERNGSLWYVNPNDLKKYLINKEKIILFFASVAHGISNDNLKKISYGSSIARIADERPQQETPTSTTIIVRPPGNNTETTRTKQVIENVGSAIINGDKTKASLYVTPNMQGRIEYTIDFLDSEGRLALGDIISNSSLSNTTATTHTYSTSFTYSGYTRTLEFKVEKQEDGSWKLANL